MVEIIPYADEGEAESYFSSERLNAEAWSNSTSVLRNKALKSATRAIDRLNFKGRKLDPNQYNEFPRYGMTIVPDDIKIACCEITLSILDGVDQELEEEDLGAITGAYGTVRVTSDPNFRKDHVKAGIPSVVAWKHLLPYLNDPREAHIERA